MKGTHLPLEDHVSRYVGGSKMIGNRVSGQAFMLRPNETSLSVNWLEFFGPTKSLEEQIQKVREVFTNKLKIGKTARFAILNNGPVLSHVEEESPSLSLLSIKHDPLEEDPSHSGIFDIPLDDLPIIAELIADTVTMDDLHPVVKP